MKARSLLFYYRFDRGCETARVKDTCSFNEQPTNAPTHCYWQKYLPSLPANSTCWKFLFVQHEKFDGNHWVDDYIIIFHNYCVAQAPKVADSILYHFKNIKTSADCNHYKAAIGLMQRNREEVLFDNTDVNKELNRNFIKWVDFIGVLLPNAKYSRLAGNLLTSEAVEKKKC